MNREQFVKIMSAIIERYNTLNTLYDKTVKLIGDCDRMVESTNLEPIIDAVAEVVGDDSDWIYWYIFDNDCGKKDYKAFIDGKEFSVETLDNLWELIQNDKGE